MAQYTSYAVSEEFMLWRVRSCPWIQWQKIAWSNRKSNAAREMDDGKEEKKERGEKNLTRYHLKSD